MWNKIWNWASDGEDFVTIRINRKTVLLGLALASLAFVYRLGYDKAVKDIREFIGQMSQQQQAPAAPTDPSEGQPGKYNGAF